MDLSKYQKQMWVKNEEPILVEKVDLPKDSVGWLVIDSIGFGTSGGGVRFGHNISLEEVKLLAEEMTSKYSFYNLPAGGAKAGICCSTPVTTKEKHEILFNFGKSLKPLICSRFYMAGTDMGTKQDDIDQLNKGAGLKAKEEYDVLDTGYYTAISVSSAIKAISSFNNMELRGARIGIQGFGKVGINLLRFASSSGLKLVAVSVLKGALYAPDGLNIEKIFELVEKFGDDFVSHYNEGKQIHLEEFFEKEMDVICPCAGIYPIHTENIRKIKAKIIVPGCNVAATKEVERLLYNRGIVYLPGFVCNAGGVLGLALRFFGVEKNERSDFLDRGIQKKVRNIMIQAKNSKEAPAEIAYRIVKKNQERFIFGTKEKMNQKVNPSMGFLRNTLVSKQFLKILFYLARNKLLFPNFVINRYRKIVFERLFGR